MKNQQLIDITCFETEYDKEANFSLLLKNGKLEKKLSEKNGVCR